MRVDVKKFLFIGLEEQRADFFKNAQKAGVINFIETDKGRGSEADLGKITAAIKILRGLQPMPQEEPQESPDTLTERILMLKKHLDKLSEEHRLTRLEIARVAVFGNFSLDDLKFLESSGHVHIRFFFSKQGAFDQTERPEGLIYIDSEHGLDYFVSISQEMRPHPKLVEMRIEKPVGILRDNLKAIERDIHETEKQLRPYSKYNTFLHHALVHKLNSHNLHEAIGNAQNALDDTLFIISGWVPVNKIAEIQSVVTGMHVFAEEIAVEPSDTVPTYLENNGLSRMGEDLVHIYDTPSPTDNDPSLWVLFSFAFFFSFIVGDGGYGLIFLLGALYIRYKHGNLGETNKRILNLVTLVCLSCVAWGFLTSSFFGISLSPDNPLRKYSLIQWLVEKKAAYHMQHHDATYNYWVDKFPQLKEVTNPAEFVKQAATISSDGSFSYDLMSKFSDNIMIELALFIGVVHITLSMLRYLRRNWVMLGWIAFIIGGYLYFPKYLDAASMTQYLLGVSNESAAQNGLYLMIGGISLAILISIFKNKLLGLLEVMTAIQIFGDILSYLRLYALGLAGAIVSSTINESAALLPFVISVILMIFGHAINILLAIMSGVIHGLRLNFLEWYHYSFEGGGKMFKPLQKLKIE